MKGIIGKKVGMSRLFNEDGTAVPVTIIQAGPCPVVQVKRDETDGYEAVQLGFDNRRRSRTNKPLGGHYARANVQPCQVLREFRGNVEGLEAGDVITVDIFAVGDKVDVSGLSKGRGFVGTVKRYSFRGGPKTHGQSDRHRAPGSIGSSSYPSRVFKGMKMAGRMGNRRVTIRKLAVAKVDPSNNLLLVTGAVPGARNGYLMVKKS